MSSNLLYETIADEIRQMITAGIYMTGEKLPSIHDLAQKKRISHTTALKAYHLLESDGLINPVPQSGYYVSYKSEIRNKSKVSPAKLPINMYDLDRITADDDPDSTLKYFGVGMMDERLVDTKLLNKNLIRVVRSIKSNSELKLPMKGNMELRIELVKMMYQRNAELDPEQMIITTNCFSSVYLALASLCRPNDLIAVESPCNYGALRIIEKLGLRVIEIPSDLTSGMDISELEKALNRYNIKAVYVNPNCNNPLGTIMPESNKQKLAEIIGKREIPLIEDDVTGCLYFTEEQPCPIVSYDKKGYVLYCSSFSKSLIESYNVGWLTGGKFIEQILAYQRASCSQVSALLQLAIARYLESGRYNVQLRKLRKIFRARTAMMIDDIHKYFPPYTHVRQPQGGYLLWCKLPGSMDSLKLYRELSKQNLSCIPGKYFSTDDRYINYMRLSAAFYDLSSREYLKKMGAVLYSLLLDEN